ncbi:MAG: hypothetical protein KatS3mg002_0043 [Candidatus Woesearchaeota archaeon]|nr:MAG: hypothetical protein KatS3mg002_0043 [Candidatus Woesearchaeota archaeon]
MNLYGEILEGPKLRFGYSSNSELDTYSKRGLSRYGPYDSNLLRKDKVKCILLYPEQLVMEKQTLIDGLTKGEGTFKGFNDFFKIPLEFIEEISFSSDIKVILESIYQKNPDIVYILLNGRDSNIYSEAKSNLLANGIPSQMVTSEKIKNPTGRQHVLENICLASYGKIGGTPWTISTTDTDNKLVLGVSRAQDYNGKYLVGFVVLFTNDGDFLFINSKAPVISWDQYTKGLSELVESSIIEYTKIKGSPTSITIHFHKRPGKGEIEAIENALKETLTNIPYAIVHVNEYSNFRLFDSSHLSYIPPKGFSVRLSSHESLILLDGRIDGNRYRIGVPRVLNVRIDKRSTLDRSKFSDLIKQIYHFSYINWRGFNAAATPITLNYSKLIARMIIELGVENWNQIIAGGKLRDKAWFL